MFNEGRWGVYTSGMIQPRHVLCVLGTWDHLTEVRSLVAEVAGADFSVDDDYSMLQPDERMPEAFEASADRVSPSLTVDDYSAIRNHRAVAYVLSPALEAATAVPLSTKALTLVDAFLERGALAVKCESSGIAHGVHRWRQIAHSVRSSDALERASALYSAWVRRPLSNQGMHYSCGMHLLGERDIELPATGDVFADIEWMDAIALYILGEKPARGLHDGDGFRRSTEDSRRVLTATACTRYENDDFFFNPYGYWRVG